MFKKIYNLLSYIRSIIITIPLIYLNTIVMGTLSLVASVFDRTGRLQHLCSRVWAQLLLWSVLARVRVRGLEKIDPSKTYLFVANHQSYIDIPALFANLPTNFRILAKKSLFSVPFMGWHLRRSGHIPIDRSSSKSGLKSLYEAAERVKSGTSVIVFPEGTRSVDGAIHEFKGGSFLLATRAGVPIVPITINGTRAVLIKDSWHLHPGKIELIIHDSIDASPYTPKNIDELAQRTREIIVKDFVRSQN
jgi:1-acyl-sn-glycerol-3-phosphate acyltransferase